MTDWSARQTRNTLATVVANLTESKAAGNAALKTKEMNSTEDEELLETVEARRSDTELREHGQIRCAAAREIWTKMSKPTHGSWKRQKKSGRCLAGVTQVTWEIRARNDYDKLKIDVHFDSDSANGLQWKSTS